MKTSSPDALNWNSSAKRRRVVNQHTGNGSGRQSRKDTSNQRGERDLGYLASTALAGKLGNDTDLDSDGGEVSEAAEGIGGDEAGAVGELGDVEFLVGDELGELVVELVFA